jgi:hypothetical protein
MTYIPFSAFDSILWSYHANMDRLWAIWSAINPDSYVIPLKNNVGTYAEAPRTIGDMKTTLWPFRKDSTNSFHTAASVRDTQTFGDSYPQKLSTGTFLSHSWQRMCERQSTIFTNTRPANLSLAELAVSDVGQRCDEIGFSTSRVSDNRPLHTWLTSSSVSLRQLRRNGPRRAISLYRKLSYRITP